MKSTITMGLALLLARSRTLALAETWNWANTGLGLYMQHLVESHPMRLRPRDACGILLSPLSSSVTRETSSEGEAMEQMSIQKTDAVSTESPVLRKPGLWRELRRSKMAVAGLTVTSIMVLMALFSLAGDAWGKLRLLPDPKDTDLQAITQPPSASHPLGTDDMGRDIASRIVYGSRISLSVGIVGQAISLVIGLAIGAVAGYYGGWLDNILMRFTDIIFAFPTALFAIAVSAVFRDRTIVTLFLILGLIGWAGIARIVRGAVLSVKHHEFAEAARAIGGGDARIILRHILPNSLAPVIVAASIGVAGNILTEAWLSFLGLGLEAGVPSWGNMIRDGQQFITTKPWICFFPGLAIIIAVLGFNLLGDGLRDILDPRLRGKQVGTGP